MVEEFSADLFFVYAVPGGQSRWVYPGKKCTLVFLFFLVYRGNMDTNNSNVYGCGSHGQVHLYEIESLRVRNVKSL